MSKYLCLHELMGTMYVKTLIAFVSLFTSLNSLEATENFEELKYS